jgi:transcription elongation factor Elf1
MVSKVIDTTMHCDKCGTETELRLYVHNISDEEMWFCEVCAEKMGNEWEQW